MTTEWLELFLGEDVDIDTEAHNTWKLRGDKVAHKMFWLEYKNLGKDQYYTPGRERGLKVSIE